jgi:hypothetical protein
MCQDETVALLIVDVSVPCLHKRFSKKMMADSVNRLRARSASDTNGFDVTNLALATKFN